MPKSVRGTTLNAPPVEVSFDYDVEHQRIKQVANADNQITTTYYAGSYEKIIRPDGVVEKKHYISAGGVFAVMTIRSDAPGVTETRYMHGDHLGSIDVITKEDGTIDQRFSFSPFGNRRNNTAWDGAATGNPSSTTTRGYTGHEEIDSLGLVNMNARLYDPVLGRFMAADTVSSSFTASQALNRYSYVGNNPLSDVDPTGHQSVRQYLSDDSTWQTAVVAVTSFYCAYCGATLNVAFAANNGASDRQLLTTAVVSFGSAYLGSAGYSQPVRIFGTAALQIGGVLAMNSGGNRGHAILSAAFSSVAELGIYTAGLQGTSQFIAQTLASGTAAEIGDGKFANGALTVMETWAIRIEER